MGLVPADYGGMDRKKAQEFDSRVMKHFASAFPAVARQVFETCGVLEGVCVEIGSGTARLTIELAKQSNLEIYALEKAPAMFELGSENIERAGLNDRIRAVLGDAHKMPFANDFANLIVSRGSYHFWTEKDVVFKEISRILKPGGAAFVGGGFGLGHSKEDLERMTRVRDQSLGDDAKYYYSATKMEESLQLAGVERYRVLLDETGLWAVIG